MYENYSNIPFNAISYECNERLLSSESGHSIKSFEQSASDPKRTLTSSLKGALFARPF